MLKVSLVLPSFPKSLVRDVKNTPEARLLQRKIESGKVDPLMSSTVTQVVKKVAEVGKDIVDLKP